MGLDVTGLTTVLALDTTPLESDVAGAFATFKNFERRVSTLHPTANLDGTQFQAGINDMTRRYQQFQQTVKSQPVTLPKINFQGVAGQMASAIGQGLAGGNLLGTLSMIPGPLGMAAAALGSAHSMIGGTVSNAKMQLGMSKGIGADFGAFQSMGAISTGGTEAVFGAMAKMQKGIAEQSEPMQHALQKLGLTFADLAGKRPDQQFAMIADALKTIKDPAQHTAAIMEIFGKSGMEMGKLLDYGSKGMAKMQERLENLGVVITATDARVLSDMEHAFKEIKWVGQGLANTFAIGVAPMLTQAAYLMVALSERLAPVLRGFLDVVSGLVRPLLEMVDPLARRLGEGLGKLKPIMDGLKWVIDIATKGMSDFFVQVGRGFNATIKNIDDWFANLTGKKNEEPSLTLGDVLMGTFLPLLTEMGMAIFLPIVSGFRMLFPSEEHGDTVGRPFNVSTEPPAPKPPPPPPPPPPKWMETFGQMMQHLADQFLKLKVGDDFQTGLATLHQQYLKTVATVPAALTPFHPTPAPIWGEAPGGVAAPAAEPGAWGEAPTATLAQLLQSMMNATANPELYMQLQSQLESLNAVLNSGTDAINVMSVAGGAFSAVTGIATAATAAHNAARRREYELMVEKLRAAHLENSIMARNNALMQSAYQIAQSQRSPFQVFQDAVTALQRNPFLTAGQTQTGIFQAWQQFAQSVPNLVPSKGPEALQEGSVAAVAAINAWQRGNQAGSVQEQMRTILEAQRLIQENQLNVQRETLRAMGDLGVLRRIGGPR